MDEFSGRSRMLGISVVMVFVLAGCLNGIPTTGESQSEARLGAVEIRNADTEAHEVDVLIEKDDEIEYWTTRHADGLQEGMVDTLVLVPGQFADEPAEYVISVRLDNSSTWEQVSLAEVADDDCRVVQIRIEDDSDLVFFTTSGYECDEATSSPARS